MKQTWNYQRGDSLRGRLSKYSEGHSGDEPVWAVLIQEEGTGKQYAVGGDIGELDMTRLRALEPGVMLTFMCTELTPARGGVFDVLAELEDWEPIKDVPLEILPAEQG